MAQSSYAVLARHREDTRCPESASILTEDWEIFSGRSGEVMMAAALACTDQADFLRRIEERRDMHTGLPSPADPED